MSRPRHMRTERAAEAHAGFHDLLRSYRLRAGLSQVRLAKLAGIDRSFLNRLESGDRCPSRIVVLRLARALGLDERDRAALLFAAGYAPVRAPLDRQAELRSLAEELQRLVMTILVYLDGIDHDES
ncbi:helix-turn-helix transcriptional regulator (plasmid) [Thermomicrobium sp. 4228-Ro]|uniref:helix-turn-helix transcriptional regulator n=1 Tax=Thermomicrobium sp. 4228-Ro TaxID=2993937 RepID=UPI002248C07B|nr:helix-turn-helix transcriptional regulator [Thermomicrobium sp. 4228-Ro]MCX2728534.1 helix-turn-helix transcriptional regulator [Thermomicrobium sp. 4228-Ro]